MYPYFTDPQMGRKKTIRPLADIVHSTYSYSFTFYLQWQYNALHENEAIVAVNIH